MNEELTPGFEKEKVVQDLKNKVAEIYLAAKEALDDEAYRKEHPGGLSWQGIHLSEQEVKELMDKFGDLSFLETVGDMNSLHGLVQELATIDSENIILRELYEGDVTWQGAGNTLVNSLMQKKDEGFYRDLIKRLGEM